MENITKNRWLYFILGLVLGAILSLFFYDNIMNETTPEKEVAVTSDSLQNRQRKATEPVEEKKSRPVKKRKPEKTRKATEKILKKKTVTDTILPDSVASDSLMTDVNADTVHHAENPADIVVVQDELLFSRVIIPAGDKSVFLCDNGSDMDSMLVDNRVASHGDGIIVEFWKSPVNFRGYKLNSRKLVLFGVYEFDSLLLEYNHEKTIRLRYKKQEFDLMCSDEFIPLNIKN